MGEIWRIKASRHGGGSFLCPPGHPALTHTLEGFWSAGEGTPRVTRASGPNFIGGIGDVAGELGNDIPAHIRAQADRLHANAELTCSADWVANVYGYFRNSYSPDGADRDVSHSVIYKPGTCQQCGRSEARGAHAPEAPTPRGESWHQFRAVARPPADRHLGYLMVRQFFPDHVPDLALINGVGVLYGTRPCVHCGAVCQYEARFDGWAPYDQPPACNQSPTGKHEIDRG